MVISQLVFFVLFDNEYNEKDTFIPMCVRNEM